MVCCGVWPSNSPSNRQAVELNGTSISPDVVAAAVTPGIFLRSLPRTLRLIPGPDEPVRRRQTTTQNLSPPLLHSHPTVSISRSTPGREVTVPQLPVATATGVIDAVLRIRASRKRGNNVRVRPRCRSQTNPHQISLVGVPLRKLSPPTISRRHILGRCLLGRDPNLANCSLRGGWVSDGRRRPTGMGARSASS